MHNFVTRDGTPPDEIRRIARAQLAAYPNVEVRDVRVDAIRGTRGAFDVKLGDEAVVARRILLCTGMTDELPALPGLAAVWGTAALICPRDCTSRPRRDARVRAHAARLERGRHRVHERHVAGDVVFLHPKQHQVAVVTALGVELDDHGYVRVNAMTGETSVSGVYAGGDLTTRGQSAIFAAAAGVLAAAGLNHELTTELVMRSATPPA